MRGSHIHKDTGTGMQKDVTPFASRSHALRNTLKDQSEDQNFQSAFAVKPFLYFLFIDNIAVVEGLWFSCYGDQAGGSSCKDNLLPF